MNKYTVVGLCLCGCENSFVEHNEASNPEQAEIKVAEQRRYDYGECRIIAVFEGHIQDICEHVHTPED